MDNNLLSRLFKTPSKNKEEQKIRIVIAKELNKLNVDYSIDLIGNMYNISKKGKPLLSAHLDTVQDDIDISNIKHIKIKNGIIRGKGVIGGDDKCGIYIILDTLKTNKDVNFVFSVQEETGGIGISYFLENNDISHIPYCLVLDRRGLGDIVCSNNDYGVPEFEEEIFSIGKSYGFKPASGIWSDADIISDYISCANLSVGYYNEHTKNEYVVLEDLENSLNFTRHILENINERFDVPFKKVSFNENKCDLCNLEGPDIYMLETVFNIKVCNKCLKDIKWEVNSIIDEKGYSYDYEELYG